MVAGMGNRLKDAASGNPKCMVEVAGKSIAERQIDNLLFAGIRRILLVTGYQASVLKRFLKEKYPFLDFVHNERYADTNTIYSLYLAFSRLHDDFIFLNGDVVFGRKILTNLLASPGTGLAVEFKACCEEEVKVALEGSRIVGISKQVPLHRASGEFTGIALFRREMQVAFYESLKFEIETVGNVKDYFERALDRIADRVELKALDIVGEPFVEVDFPEDLERARQLPL